jgi:hypothetical protein
MNYLGIIAHKKLSYEIFKNLLHFVMFKKKSEVITSSDFRLRSSDLLMKLSN